MVFKELLAALHDAGKAVVHIILIPVVATLKGISSFTAHLVEELSKV
jgi:hypothetical protein